MIDELNLNMDAFFGAMTVICAVMVVLWVFRIKSRGSRAMVMAAAFAMLGIFAQLIRVGVPQFVLIGLAVVIVALLAVDALMRIKEQEAKRS